VVYIDDNTKEKLQKLKLGSIYFLINFDNVLTDGNSCDTWSVITNNMKLKKRFVKKFADLNNKFVSTELDTGADLEDRRTTLKHIWRQKIDLLRELEIDDKKITKFMSKQDNLKIRDGVREFFSFTHENEIPVIIISDGIFEIIQSFLNYNKCNYDNIHIVSNNLFYDSQSIQNDVVCSLNKNESIINDNIKKEIKDRKVSILLASAINDINILSKEKLNDSIKIDFLDKFINENFDTFLNYFNIICTHNTSFDVLLAQLKQIN
jgi:2-hydroxy-3-keto-5-methylthiopentenyl-1-phosphate phosphatase